MGVFLRVWIPDHVREAMDRELADGPLRDDEELVRAALDDLLGTAGPPHDVGGKEVPDAA